MSEVLLSVAGLTVRAGDRTLLSNIAFQARPGERLVLLGPNGAGKSTLMRALAGDLLTMDFVQALYAKGMSRGDVLRHVARNAAATALSVMGLQLGYLLGGSILIETVFNWPGSGFLLSNAIFQRDLPLLQGTILVLALFFVAMNLVVDVAQAAIDPRIKRS